jgi:type VI secretion system (T6SS) baseplate-like injector VgrG
MPFYGKYRGTVVNNIDPMTKGRLMVSVPAVTPSSSLNWAMPCTPYAGDGVGLFMLPPIGANLWVEFEGGDPDYPIWSGCFWGDGEAPVNAAEAIFVKRLKTRFANVTLDETPGAGGFRIEINPPMSSMPASIVIDMQGITLTHGGATINLNTAAVKVNNGALEVI